ncbi:LacI family transcriptional regulator [Pontibacter ummariensis]|uniref:Transcriptional regulator, LacI family n=1 Tax=Pontibacter ummariensis TaxID=1610492 RepID=A0A239G4U0_9BACT|nr:LacI family DNA-binding transcriptional regulator [Pontibacter ummariensis]PRY11659.1 LacI family transcriptional regulator [Pontibacter ummariensis]SNS63513.1 transcriptional regulator, LacI family [Pontibacter ummariensis]
MKNKRPSIRDIAKQLNVSTTTVSFVLNGKAKEKRISEQLAEQVLKFVEEVGYKPNQIAQSLRTGKSRIISLMVEDISNAFFSKVARLIEEAAHQRGYKIIYCSTENSVDKTRELIRMFRDWQIDGYIITPPAGVEEDIQGLINDKHPVVLFDRFFPRLKTNYVIVDNFNSTYKAVNHLISQGYSRIAFVTLESEQVQMNDRLNGYKKALEDCLLPPLVKSLNFDKPAEENKKEITSFLVNNRQLDAIVFATNYISVWGLEAIRDITFMSPADVGIVSFDDHDVFPLFAPPVSAVAQPVEEISKEVINIMLKQLEDPEQMNTNKHVVLPAKLIIRESSLKKKLA